MTVSRCPECGAANSRVTSTGLGGLWKILCRACGYHYDEGQYEQYEGPPQADPVVIPEEE